MRFALIILLLVLFFGCKSAHKQDRETAAINPTTRVETIHDNLKRNTEAIDNEISEVAKDPASAVQRVGRIAIINNANKPLLNDLGKVNKDIAGMQRRGDSLQKQADSSNQGFYRVLNYSSWIGGFVLSLGIMLALTGKPMGIGVGAMGAAMVGVFMTMRAASPVLIWVAAGMGVIAVGGVAYIAIWRLREWRKMRAEKVATRELVMTVQKVRENLPDDQDKKLFGDPAQGITGEVAAVQSPQTQTLVAAAKTEMRGDLKAAELRPPLEPAT